MFNFRQREVLGEKLMDLGNIAVGSLVFGYIVRSEAFSGFSLILGIAIATTMYIFSIALVKD